MVVTVVRRGVGDDSNPRRQCMECSIASLSRRFEASLRHPGRSGFFDRLVTEQPARVFKTDLRLPAIDALMIV